MNRETVVMVPVEVRQRGVAIRGLVLPLTAAQLTQLEAEQERVAVAAYETGWAQSSDLLAPGVTMRVARQSFGRLVKQRGAQPPEGAMFLAWQSAVGGLVLFHSGHKFLVLRPSHYGGGLIGLKTGTVRVVQVD